jgi:hypothetical protein
MDDLGAPFFRLPRTEVQVRRRGSGPKSGVPAKVPPFPQATPGADAFVRAAPKRAAGLGSSALVPVCGPRQLPGRNHRDRSPSCFRLSTAVSAVDLTVCRRPLSRAPKRLTEWLAGHRRSVSRPRRVGPLPSPGAEAPEADEGHPSLPRTTFRTVRLSPWRVPKHAPGGTASVRRSFGRNPLPRTHLPFDLTTSEKCVSPKDPRATGQSIQPATGRRSVSPPTGDHPASLATPVARFPARP